MTRESDLARRSAEIRNFFRSAPCNEAAVSQFLRDVELEKDEYNAEINRLKITIQRIEGKRDRLTTTAELYKSLLSPIYKMPLEIHTIIFTFVCAENVLSRSKLPKAIRLSMVCGRWRDIVHTTPSLWSNIKIDFRNWKADFSILNRLAKLFMERSASYPLQIRLFLPNGDFSEGQSEREEANSALRSLIANSERWRCVFFSVESSSSPSSIFDVFGPIRSRLPLLTSLGFERRGTSMLNIPLHFFDNCPALRSLHISPPFPGRYLTKVPSLPWSQIRWLRLFIAYNVGAFPILSRCSGVQHLEANRVGFPYSQSYSDHVVSNEITALDVTSAFDQNEVDGVFQHTTLKALSSLKICGGIRSMSGQTTWLEWNETRLRDFLQRSSCTITSLYLKNLPISDEQTLSLLRMMPNISSLCIEELRNEGENRIITKTFLNGFDAKTSLTLPFSSPLVPRLAELKLVVHAKDLHSDPFTKALLCRWLPDPSEATELGVDCLQSIAIVVILGPNQEGGCLDGLLGFRDAGMRLAITYGTVSELYPHD